MVFKMKYKINEIRRKLFGQLLNNFRIENIEVLTKPSDKIIFSDCFLCGENLGDLYLIARITLLSKNYKPRESLFPKRFYQRRVYVHLRCFIKANGCNDLLRFQDRIRKKLRYSPKKYRQFALYLHRYCKS